MQITLIAPTRPALIRAVLIRAMLIRDSGIRVDPIRASEVPAGGMAAPRMLTRVAPGSGTTSRRRTARQRHWLAGHRPAGHRPAGPWPAGPGPLPDPAAQSRPGAPGEPRRRRRRRGVTALSMALPLTLRLRSPAGPRTAALTAPSAPLDHSGTSYPSDPNPFFVIMTIGVAAATPIVMITRPRWPRCPRFRPRPGATIFRTATPHKVARCHGSWGGWFGTVQGLMYHNRKSGNIHHTKGPGKDPLKELVISFTSSHSRTSEGPVIGFAHPAAREFRLGGTQAPGRCCVGGGPVHPRVKCPPEPSGAT